MNNFIIVSLTGGLGDQINQYIFGHILSEKLNCKLIFDTSYYKKKKNSFKIQITKFKIDSSVKFENKLFKLPFRFIQYNRFWPIFFFNIFIGRFFFKKQIEYFVYDYWHYPFIKNKYQFKKNSYYFGYWHSLAFFKKNLSKIKKEFSLKKESENLKKIKKKITKSWVALHIRGGDFLNNIHAKILNDNYYTNGINYFIKKIRKPIFYIFTNDKTHSQTLLKNIKKNIDIKYISNFNLKDFEEFELMRHFKNLIIANSTFSWTASYMSHNAGVKIISPKIWDNKYKKYDPKFELDKKSKNMIIMK
jgi:hypothetical protein